MPNSVIRKPVGNFFIKRSLQLGLIVKILAVSIASSILSVCTLLVVYFYKYSTTILYLWNQNTNGLDRKESIMLIILPTLIISAVVCLVLSFGIGLYASRKYAVPVFKIEQWASRLLEGKMTEVLRFRESEEMKELSEKCNELGAMFRETLAAVKVDVKRLKDAGVDNPAVDAIAKELDKYDL